MFLTYLTYITLVGQVVLFGLLALFGRCVVFGLGLFGIYATYFVIFIGLFNIITYSIYLASNGKTEKRRDGDTETRRNGETEKRKEENTSVSITRAPGHLEFFFWKTCSRFAPPNKYKKKEL